MANFLILVPKLEKYTKKDLNRGKTPKSIYSACCAIREAFCLSYNIRKKNNVFLYFLDSYILIKLVGRKLRYLGPDERSQAILLLKALKLTHSETHKKDTGWIPSTPGFFIRNFPHHESFLHFLETIIRDIPIIVWDKPFHKKFPSSMKEVKLSSLDNYEYPFFVIPSIETDDLNAFMQKIYEIIAPIKSFHLPKLHLSSERVLYINYLKDKTSNG
ncbi:MAG: hypothetical protein ACOC44_07010 [Promethearchaeia archaeon]